MYCGKQLFPNNEKLIKDGATRPTSHSEKPKCKHKTFLGCVQRLKLSCQFRIISTLCSQKVTYGNTTSPELALVRLKLCFPEGISLAKLYFAPTSSVCHTKKPEQIVSVRSCMSDVSSVFPLTQHSDRTETHPAHASACKAYLNVLMLETETQPQTHCVQRPQQVPADTNFLRTSNVFVPKSLKSRRNPEYGTPTGQFDGGETSV